MKELTLTIVLTFTLITLAAVTVSNLKSKEAAKEVEQNTGLNDLCMLKVIRFGESYKKIAPGFYEYTLIHTPEGIEVWVPCKRS